MGFACQKILVPAVWWMSVVCEVMSRKVKFHGGTLEDMGKHFVSLWHRLESGEKVQERHATFPDLPSMLNALTPKRLELLRDVHREPASSVRPRAMLRCAAQLRTTLLKW